MPFIFAAREAGVKLWLLSLQSFFLSCGGRGLPRASGRDRHWMQETHCRVTNSPDDMGSIQETSLPHSSRETQVAPRQTHHRDLAWSNTGERSTWVRSPVRVSESPVQHLWLVEKGSWAALGSRAGGGEGRRRWAPVERPWGCQAPLIRMRLFHSITAGWFSPRSLSFRGCCLQKVEAGTWAGSKPWCSSASPLRGLSLCAEPGPLRCPRQLLQPPCLSEQMVRLRK